MNLKRPADPNMVNTQIQQAERRLAELQQQRAEVLLLLADAPGDEDIHASIAAHDQSIKRTEDRIVNLNASLSEAGRRDADAAVKRMLAEAEALNEKALNLTYTKRLDAASAVDAAVADLVAKIETYEALGREASSLIYTGMRPLCEGKHWRRGFLTELARAPHGTLTALLQMLQGRDVRAMRMREHAQACAERLTSAVERTRQEAAARAAGAR
jgi:hypothetical protein